MTLPSVIVKPHFGIVIAVIVISCFSDGAFFETRSGFAGSAPQDENELYAASPTFLILRSPRQRGSRRTHKCHRPYPCTSRIAAAIRSGLGM
jgi:hypothetical protein